MKSIFASIVFQVNRFAPIYNHGDRIWEFYLSFGRRWHYLNVKEYERTYYFWGDNFDSITTEDSSQLERFTNQQVDYIRKLPGLLLETYNLARKDPVAYHRLLLAKVSPGLRTGIIPRSVVQRSLPDYMSLQKVRSRQ
jgi:hypothetical protein